MPPRACPCVDVDGSVISSKVDLFSPLWLPGKEMLILTIKIILFRSLAVTFLPEGEGAGGGWGARTCTWERGRGRKERES